MNQSICACFVDNRKDTKEGKMEKIIDCVFVTHLPAFYKVNLYNKLAERLNIFVIFISNSSIIRTNDFTQTTHYTFQHIIINTEPFEKRSIYQSSLNLMSILKQLKFKKIILGGWDLIEFWITWKMFPTEKLAIALESSIHESKTTGPKSWLKKIFMAKLSKVYVSGLFQQQLAKNLNFTQKVIITGGVGLINPPKIGNLKNFTGRFLYLGRFSQEKNIMLLLELFGNILPESYLTLVGKGPLYDFMVSELKKHNFKNISVEKHVPNDQISRLFSRHDVLILPSQQEPWGLVVEEAIAHGLPVIVSDKVGCHSEVVNHKSNGYVFQLKDKNPEENLIEMAKACYWVGGNYIDLINQIRTHPEYHWQKRALKQVEAYF